MLMEMSVFLRGSESFVTFQHWEGKKTSTTSWATKRAPAKQDGLSTPKDFQHLDTQRWIEISFYFLQWKEPRSSCIPSFSGPKDELQNAMEAFTKKHYRPIIPVSILSRVLITIYTSLHIHAFIVDICKHRKPYLLHHAKRTVPSSDN